MKVEHKEKNAQKNTKLRKNPEGSRIRYDLPEEVRRQRSEFTCSSHRQWYVRDGVEPSTMAAPTAHGRRLPIIVCIVVPKDRYANDPVPSSEVTDGKRS